MVCICIKQEAGSSTELGGINVMDGAEKVAR